MHTHTHTHTHSVPGAYLLEARQDIFVNVITRVNLFVNAINITVNFVSVHK